MLIDWFTVTAQVINFLVLLWLMKRFLYKPILHAIDERERQVAAELAHAATTKAEAQKARAEFEHKKVTFDQQRAALLRTATDEAQAERQRLLAEARQAAATLRSKQQETLRSEISTLQQAIGRRTQQEIFAIARKTLTDLAGTSLEERMTVVFTRRLRALDGPVKAGLAAALKNAADPVLVRSAFDLPAVQQAAIQQALNETFVDPTPSHGRTIPVRFATAPDLISGIELSTNGQKVAWSIADYLASLEKSVVDLLHEQGQSDAKAALSTPESARP